MAKKIKKIVVENLDDVGGEQEAEEQQFIEHPFTNEYIISELQQGAELVVQFDKKMKNRWWNPEEKYDPSVPHRIIVKQVRETSSLIRIFTPNIDVKFHDVWFDARDVVYAVLSEDLKHGLTKDFLEEVEKEQDEMFFNELEENGE